MIRLRRIQTVLLGATGVALAGAMTLPADASEDQTYTVAVIGDVPYGPALIEGFPAFIGQINADPDVRLVTHLGDIKDGSSVCSDDYFDLIARDFTLFRDPLVFTPGDNEWTDCHRVNNGAYDPLERLAKLREVFFAEPGKTLGQHSVAVKSQVKHGFPENVTYSRNDVVFAALHITGSNNALLPWTGLGLTQPTEQQGQEVQSRTAADLVLIHDVFERAKDDGNRAVVLQTQADMFDPTVPTPSLNNYSAFKPIVQAIVDESAAFDGPVYLFNGDSHVFNVDHPLGAESTWLGFYGVTGSADNLTRVTVVGSTLGESSWLKVTTHSTGDPLTWEQVPAN
jgi:hypothetical protein